MTLETTEAPTVYDGSFRKVLKADLGSLEVAAERCREGA